MKSIGSTAVGASAKGTVPTSEMVITPIDFDLGLDGVTPNDPGDNYDGPTGVENFPVHTSAVQGGANRDRGHAQQPARPGMRVSISLQLDGPCSHLRPGRPLSRLGRREHRLRRQRGVLVRDLLGRR